MQITLTPLQLLICHYAKQNISGSELIGLLNNRGVQEASVYGCVHRLKKAGLINSAHIKGRGCTANRLYSLTAKGAECLGVSIQTYKLLLEEVQ